MGLRNNFLIIHIKAINKSGKRCALVEVYCSPSGLIPDISVDSQKHDKPLITFSSFELVAVQNLSESRKKSPFQMFTMLYAETEYVCLKKLLNGGKRMYWIVLYSSKY